MFLGINESDYMPMLMQLAFFYILNTKSVYSKIADWVGTSVGVMNTSRTGFLSNSGVGVVTLIYAAINYWLVPMVMKDMEPMTVSSLVIWSIAFYFFTLPATYDWVEANIGNRFTFFTGLVAVNEGPTNKGRLVMGSFFTLAGTLVSKHQDKASA